MMTTTMTKDQGATPSFAISAGAPSRTRNLVVMLATYHECDCIGVALDALTSVRASLLAVGIEMRVLLVDDESPDGTAARAIEVASRNGLDLAVCSAPRAGLGRAYMRGFAAISAEQWADTIVTLDADGQHDPAMIPDLVAERNRLGADLLIGSRWVKGGRVVGLTRSRRILSRFGNLLFAAVTGTYGVCDATTSYRVFSVEMAAAFDPGALSVSGYSFFSSFVGVTSASGLRIAEHPIVFAPRVAGASKLQLDDVLQFARNLPALRRQVRALRSNPRSSPLPHARQG